MMPGVYAFNDKSKDPWFAPAGLNRGALPNVTRAEKVIGNQTTTVKKDENDDCYIQITGSYTNRSRFVTVNAVNNPTPNYLDAAGVVGGTLPGAYSASLPLVASGTFGGGTGNFGATNFYGDIASGATGTQGVGPNDYTQSISLLKNKDLYNYNVLAIPGVISGLSAISP